MAGIDVDLVAYETSGSDVAALANEIGAALQIVHAQTKTFVPFGAGAIVRGILVRTEVEAPTSVNSAADAIVAALNEVGLIAGKWQSFPVGEPPSSSYNGPGQATAKLRILVGSKL